MAAAKIAIIGAGPVGCMLARLLHIHNIDCTVFESDTSPNYRSQGGTLDLHTDTGLAALKEADLFDEFLELARYDGESLLQTDSNLKVLMKLGPSGGKDGTRLAGQRPEIDRSQLRQLLAESLPPDMIRWGHHLQSVEADGRLVFQNTTESGYDLVVGAEGAWSKVRSVLSDQKPFFTGISMYELSIPEPEARVPELHKLVNRGSIFAFSGDGRRVSVQQMGSGELNLYTVMKTDEDWIEKCRKKPKDLAGVKEQLLGKDGGDGKDGKGGIFSGFHPLLRDGIFKAEGKCTPRSLYMLPVGFRWAHRLGYTVIGDAAHVMTPFAGEGVNVGLDDARKLAAAIVAATAAGTAGKGQVGDEVSGRLLERLDQAVAKFEEEMFPRVRRFSELTETSMNALFFGPADTHAAMAEIVAAHARFQTPWILHPAVTAGTHLFFYLKRVSGL